MPRRAGVRGRPDPPGAPGDYGASVSSRTLPRLLLAVALVLLTCHTVLWVIHYRVQELPWLLLQLFDVNDENNLPTWFSGFLLLLASAFLWLCAQQRRAAGRPWAGHWTALAVGFLLLSVDEIAGVHETINSVIVMTWAIPAVFIVLPLGLAFVPFLLALPRPTALLFLIAGVIYVTGGAGMEIVGNEMVGQRLKDTLQYRLTTLVEEALEMLGVILFLYALLRYMSGAERGSVRASVKVE